MLQKHIEKHHIQSLQEVLPPYPSMRNLIIRYLKKCLTPDFSLVNLFIFSSLDSKNV